MGCWRWFTLSWTICLTRGLISTQGISIRASIWSGVFPREFFYCAICYGSWSIVTECFSSLAFLCFLSLGVFIYEVIFDNKQTLVLSLLQKRNIYNQLVFHTTILISQLWQYNFGGFVIAYKPCVCGIFYYINFTTNDALFARVSRMLHLCQLFLKSVVFFFWSYIISFPYLSIEMIRVIGAFCNTIFSK